jgi:hypothetical protein
VIGLAIPEDDATPDTPFVAVTKGQFEALDPNRAPAANSLRSGQIRRLLGEEQLMAALVTTSSELL